MSELEHLRVLFAETAAPSAEVRTRARERVFGSSARTGRTRPRNSRLLPSIAALGLLALTLSALGLAGGLDGIFGGEPVTAISNDDQFTLDVTGAENARVSLIGSTGGRSFYRVARNGGYCYATGRADNPTRFGLLSCPSSGEDSPFPSRHEPILDQSQVVATDMRAPRVVLLQGIATDPVESVGVIDTAGNVTLTPVVGNVFATRALPDTPTRAFVAYDEAGTEIYRHCYVTDCVR